MCVRDSYTTVSLSLPISFDSPIGFNQAERKVQSGMHQAGTEEVSLPIYSIVYMFQAQTRESCFLHKYIIKIFPFYSLIFYFTLSFL